jgi:hypothetical protein
VVGGTEVVKKLIFFKKTILTIIRQFNQYFNKRKRKVLLATSYGNNFKIIFRALSKAL